jgi:hypothetical protein
VFPAQRRINAGAVFEAIPTGLPPQHFEIVLEAFLARQNFRECGLDGRRCSLVGISEQMCVKAQGNGRVAVSDPSTHRDDVEACRDKLANVRVPKARAA